MRFVLLAVLVCLAGCSAPVQKNFGAPSKRVTALGLEFQVTYTTAHAEAYRITPMMRGDFARVRLAAAVAMEKASGCEINPARMQGDPAKFAAELIC